jgi:hypothetical protein
MVVPGLPAVDGITDRRKIVKKTKKNLKRTKKGSKNAKNSNITKITFKPDFSKPKIFTILKIHVDS